MSSMNLIIFHSLQRLGQSRWFEVLCDYMRGCQSVDYNLSEASDSEYDEELSGHHKQVWGVCASSLSGFRLHKCNNT